MVYNNNSKGILLYGDSVLFGIGASTRNKGCEKVLRSLIKKENLSINIGNRSIPDINNTNYALQNLESKVLKSSKDYVLIMLGNIDSRIDNPNLYVPLDKYSSNLRIIIRKIYDKKMNPVIINLQPINDELILKNDPTREQFINQIGSAYEWQKKYSDKCEEISNEMNVNLIDIRKPLERDITKIMAIDGYHPNDEGHNIIAKVIYSYLTEIFKGTSKNSIFQEP